MYRALVVLALVSGCVTTPKKPAPVLAIVETQTLPVRFLGQPYAKEALFVCAAWPDTETFDCVDWASFSEQFAKP